MQEQMTASPGILNIPLAISSQLVAYNVPGLNNTSLRLDGPTLAGVYAGKVRNLDDAAIVAMNPGVKLPHQPIVPIHRREGSGDSFMFSQFLTYSTDSWEFGPSFGTDIAWPSAPGALGAKGNAGMVKAAAMPYSVAYIGGSFFREIAAAHLGTATLKNQAGNFVAASPKTLRLAAAELGARTPHDERLSLVFAPGAESYPLVNYEYAIVAAKQSNPATATALREFLLWAIGAGEGNDQKSLDPLHFVTSAEYVRALSDAQVRRIDNRASRHPRRRPQVLRQPCLDDEHICGGCRAAADMRSKRDALGTRNQSDLFCIAVPYGLVRPVNVAIGATLPDAFSGYSVTLPAPRFGA
jgi:phosphate transport system substrate-binding protein